MAGNIKGITIEFDGNTTKLDQALRSVDKQTASIDRELKKVNNALKFNPTSVELWRQKQQLLTQKVTETKMRLDALKQAQAQLDAKGVDKNSEEYRRLQREIVETESKLKTFKSQLQSVGNVKLRAASAQLKAIGSKATAAGQALTPLSTAAGLLAGAFTTLATKSGEWADDLNTLSKKYGISTKELQKYAATADLVDVDTETIVKSQMKLTKSMDSAAHGSERQMEAFDKLGVSYKNQDGTLKDSEQVWQETIEALGEMENETDRNALAMTLFGKSAADLNPLIEDGGETYQRVAEMMEKYGLDFVDQETIDKANEFNDQLDTMKAIGTIAFQALGAELAGVLLPALSQVVDAVGQFAQWLSGLDPVVLAVITGVSGLVALLAPALLLFGALASAAGTLMGVLAGISAPVLAIVAGIAALIAVFIAAYNSSKTFRDAINQLGTELISIFAPLVKQVISGLKELAGVIIDTATSVANDLAPVIEALMPVISAAAKIIVAVLGYAFQQIVTRIKTVASIVKSLAKIFQFVFLAIVSYVKGAQVKIKLIITSIKNIFNTLASVVGKVKSIFNSVKEAITHPVETAVGLVKAAISKIKSALSGHLSLPHIKLPHFSISGKFSLNPPQIPKISVSWYKNGGIFTRPTLAGIGEAGPEGVIPLDKLWMKLDAIAAAAAPTGVNNYNTFNISGDDGRQIANQIVTALELRMRS